MSGQPFRLAQGGVIERGQKLSFSFDGRVLTGLAGDTLASALLANGVHLVGRSFKYHRPRGILTAGAEEPNALVELREGARREPNTKATTIELYDGLSATSQNRWPSLEFDMMAVNGLFSKLFVAGFYYKTFMWPPAAWERLFEPLIRRAAGLGRLATEPDPDTYEKAHAFCDVLVAGGGIAGLSAALVAARAGARVIITESDSVFGGRLLSERETLDGESGQALAARLVAELASLNVRLMPRTSIIAVNDGGHYAALERVNDHRAAPLPFQPRQRLWRIIAKACVVATGGIERPVAFCGNDRPGILTASAMRSYLNRFAVAPGRRVVVFDASGDGARTVDDLAASGIEVAALVDPRQRPAHDRTETLHGAVIATTGGKRITGVTVRLADGRLREIEADALAVSGGWNPDLGLTCHHGGRPVWSDHHAAFLPGVLPPGMHVAGSARGVASLAACRADGLATGAAAAQAAGFRVTEPIPAAAEEPPARAPLWHVPGATKKAFVDFQHDVTVEDVELAHREGYRSVEHLKRYTTLGMATDQGKLASVLGQGVMAALTGNDMAQAGTVIFRPPHVPVAIGAYAGTHRGRDFKPLRKTPTHEWADARGAVFVETGLWLRAQWYPQAGETDWLESVNREVMATRAGCGICDVSTLGKIEVTGADAPAFLDFVYANTLSTLPPGKVRYGLMLREDGFVMDDGTVAHLAPGRYLVSTTTANAAKVMQHLEFCHQVLMPHLDVQMVSVTEAWAQLSLAGPRARDVLRMVVDAAHDVSDAAFPYLACGRVSVMGGVPARLYRVSFSGELGFEVAVAPRYGQALMEKLVGAGAVPYGTEALGVMRIEKGHPAGNELNGQTVARDLGLGKLMSGKKDFVGRRNAERPALVDPARPALVGLKPVDASLRLRAGAHLLPQGVPTIAAHDQGYVTSVAFSPGLNQWIGLGLLAHGPRRHGEVVRAWDPVRGGDVACRVVDPVFLDPTGGRLRA
jgi:sarcosine oxidase subunit alpha